MVRHSCINHWLGLLGIALGLVLLPSFSQAAGVQVKPAAFRLTLDPGETKQSTLTLTNDGTESIEMSTAIASVTAPGTSGELVFATTGGQALPYELSVTPATGTIPPGESMTLTLTLKVAPTAEPGGYSQGIQLTTTTASPETASGAISQRSLATVNVPVLFEVRGNRQLSGQVSSLLATPQTATAGQSVTLSTDVTNTGNVHAAATGTITVYAGQSSQVVDTLVLPRLLVFPTATREISAVWTAPKTAGQYRFVLKLNLTDPDGADVGQDLQAETTVTVRATTPWTILFLIGVVILECIWLVRTYWRRRSSDRSHPRT